MSSICYHNLSDILYCYSKQNSWRVYDPIYDISDIIDALWNFEIPAHIRLDMHRDVINTNLSLVPKNALVALT